MPAPTVYLRGLTELRITDPDELIGALEAWTATGDGAGCQPLICVGGQPSTAGWRLLELLAVGGVEFGYHGDFDWGGVRIARAVRHRMNWQPWRYDHQAYEAAVSAAHPLTPLSRLAGESAATPWAPELAAAMRQPQRPRRGGTHPRRPAPRSQSLKELDAARRAMPGSKTPSAPGMIADWAGSHPPRWQ